MPTNRISNDNNAIIAEYNNVRAEIRQLNDQIFKVLIGSLGMDVTVIGWMIAKNDPETYYPLLTLGVFILFLGCVLLLNRNRLAHRLAIFQSVFIERRISDICWGRVYFQYREEYSKRPRSFLSSCGERIAENGVNILTSAQVVNAGIFIYYALIQPYTAAQIDLFKLLCFISISLLIILTLIIKKRLVEYNIITDVMINTLNNSTLTE
jgi:hypothetical protein